MILNLTQHAATPEQQQAGVVDLPPNAMAWIRMALTFGSIPSNESLAKRAEAIADFAVEQGILSGVFDEEIGFGQVMIGGAPFFMRHLEDALAARRLQPLYAFSQRVSVEKVVDGVVVKTNEFRHEGFVGL